MFFSPVLRILVFVVVVVQNLQGVYDSYVYNAFGFESLAKIIMIHVMN